MYQLPRTIRDSMGAPTPLPRHHASLRVVYEGGMGDGTQLRFPFHLGLEKIEGHLRKTTGFSARLLLEFVSNVTKSKSNRIATCVITRAKLQI
jgi:hypothetical protein